MYKSKISLQKDVTAVFLLLQRDKPYVGKLLCLYLLSQVWLKYLYFCLETYECFDSFPSQSFPWPRQFKKDKTFFVYSRYF